MPEPDYPIPTDGPADRPDLAEYAAAARGGGLVCPDCECRHFDVKGTWRLKDGTIRRLRVCRHCAHPITTSERIPGEDGGVMG
jgi:hypothetical protein